MRKRRLYAFFASISLLLLAGILFWAWLFSSPLKKRLTLEAGSYQLTGEEFLRLPFSSPNLKLLTDLNAIDTHVPGDYPVQFLVNGETQVCLLRVRDTIKPVATTQDLIIPAGIKIEPDVFLSSVTDETAVTAKLTTKQREPIKVSKLEPGQYALTLTVTDAGKNRSRYPVSLTICNIRSSCQAELGNADYSVENYRLSDAEELNWATDITSLLSQVGTHDAAIEVNGLITPVELVVADTTAPQITASDVHVWLGEAAAPEDFATDIQDASEVTMQYQTVPDYNQTGEQSISLVAIDSYGNETAFSGHLTIEKDTSGPDLLGLRDLSFPLGATITYRKSVFAIDNKDGEVKLQVDSSRVNPLKQGSYLVTYSATDSSGNESTATVHITITEPLPVSEEEVYALADEVLMELGMTDDYHVLRAIYDWCQSTIYYNGKSDKSSALQAAYDGFTTHSGDCYTYYAVADMLLTRAGYESMEVNRDEIYESFHAWNLVRYQNNWYHFDACPLMNGETFVPFLVTDDELLTFSAAYGQRYPDASHRNYYQFDETLYPPRGEESVHEP